MGKGRVEGGSCVLKKGKSLVDGELKKRKRGHEEDDGRVYGRDYE